MPAIVRPRRSREGRSALLSAGGVALGSLATGGFVVAPGLPPLDLAMGAAVPLGLLFGPAAALGAAAGVALAAAIRSALSWWTVLDAASYSILAYAGYRLWGVLPAVSTGEEPTLRSGGQWLEFAAVTALAGITAATVLAWGSLIRWGGSFHAVAFSELSIALASTALVGPALLYPAPSAFADRTTEYRDRVAIERGSGAFWGAVVVPALWFGVGSAASIAVEVVQLIGAPMLERQGLGSLYVPFDPALVGYGGRRVQIVLGALALSVVVAAYAPSSRTDRSTTTSPSANP